MFTKNYVPKKKCKKKHYFLNDILPLIQLNTIFNTIFEKVEMLHGKSESHGKICEVDQQ